MPKPKAFDLNQFLTSRTNAVNAQTSALKFNQLIGFSVTPMPAADLSAALLGEAQ